MFDPRTALIEGVRRLLGGCGRKTVRCVACDSSTSSPSPEKEGWHFGTLYDGDAGWLCPDCQYQDAEY